MAKDNFSKVEDLLTKGLEKMKVEELGKLAKIAQSLGRPELIKLAESALTSSAKKGLERKATLHVLRNGAKVFKKDDFYEEFKLSFGEFTKLIEKGRALTEEEWQQLGLIKAKMQLQKEQRIKDHPELENDNLVEKTRKDQVNARINVNKKWLPLS